MQVNQPKFPKTFSQKHKRKKKQTKTKTRRSNNFFGIHNRQHFFEIWFELYIVLPCSLLQTSQHQYLLANWSFHFDIKKQSFKIKEVVSFVFLQFTHMVPKNLSKCWTYMIKAIKTCVCYERVKCFFFQERFQLFLQSR